METFLPLLFSLSLSGSLVALILMPLRPLFRKVSRTWGYYVWLLVLLRMLIPFAPEDNLLSVLAKPNAPALSAAPSSQEGEMSPPTQVQPPSPTPVPENTLPETKKEPLAVPPPSRLPALGLFDYLGLLWLGIALILLSRKLFAGISSTKAVKREGIPLESGPVYETFLAACRFMRVKRKIPLLENPHLPGPVLAGVFRPVIVLPSKRADLGELALVLRHELTHYKRRDGLYKWLSEITVCLHWFNPLAYLVRREIRAACEFSCDESVLARLSPSELRSYGNALLNSIAMEVLPHRQNTALALGGDGKLLKERLFAIMKYKKSSKAVLFLALLLTAALSCGTVYAGAYQMRADGGAPAKTGTLAPVRQNQKSASALAPIRFSQKEFEAGGKISLGDQTIPAGTTCTAAFSWFGADDAVALSIVSKSGAEKKILIPNGETFTFPISAADSYTISVKNTSSDAVSEFSGLISFPGDRVSAENSVVYESVTLFPLSKGESGFPNLHDVYKNNTKKTIVARERGMCAFDKDGNPLVIDWHSLDSSSNPSYGILYDWDTCEIKSGEIDNVSGGWTLDVYGDDKNVNKIAYTLYCDKKLTFSDGTVWNNPDYDAWYKTYVGKTIGVETLNHYYPYVQMIR